MRKCEAGIFLPIDLLMKPGGRNKLALEAQFHVVFKSVFSASNDSFTSVVPTLEAKNTTGDGRLLNPIRYADRF